MKKVSLVAIIIFTVILVSCSGEGKNSKNLSVNIGWQIPWSIQWQLAQILKHTDILEKNGIQGNFKGFLYWAPLNEAALAWDVDVIFTADQPAAVLLSKNPNWVVVGRLMYNRVALYAPVDSAVSSVPDLKWKTVGLPFWAAVQRTVLKSLKTSWIEWGKDVTVSNIGMDEQIALIRKWSQNKKWGIYDALAWFDPIPAILEQDRLIKNIQEDKIVAMVLVSKKLIEEDPKIVSKIRLALDAAWTFYKSDKKTADEWFNSESKLNVSEQALRITEKFEPNFTSQTRLDFNSEDLKIMQEASDFLYEKKLVANRVNFQNYIYQQN